jgi:hypothetical protein
LYDFKEIFSFLGARREAAAGISPQPGIGFSAIPLPATRKEVDASLAPP